MIRWIRNVSKKKAVTAVAAIAVIAVAGATFINQGGTGQQAQPGAAQRTGAGAAARQFPVETQIVKLAEVGGGQVFTGSITPVYTSNVSSRISGRVTEVMVKPGDRVKVGQSLATIDTSTLQQQIAQSESALAVSAAQMQRTANDQANSAVTAEKQLAVQRANLEKAILDQQNAVASAKQQLAISQASYNKALNDQQNAIATAKQQLAISQQNMNNAISTYSLNLANAQNTLNSQQESIQNTQVNSINSLDTLQLQLEQAIINYSNVKASSAENETAVDSALQRVQSAQLALDQAQQTTPGALTSANAALLKAQGDLAAAQNSQTVQIAQEQLNRDSISLSNAQNTLAAIMETNQQTMQKDQLSLANAQASQEANLNVTKAQVEQSEQALATARSTDAIAVSNAQYQQAQTSLQILNEQLQDGVLLSPVAGVVSAINTPVGQNAGANANILSIASLDPTQATVNVSEANIGKIKVGMEMKVNVPTLNKSFDGVVLAIRPTMDAVTKAYGVDIKVNDTNQELLPGMFATSSLKSEGRKAVMVPADAVLSQPSGNAAFIVKDGRAQKVSVKVGTLTSAMFEITEGLKEGDELVVKGQELLSDKAAVQVLKPGQEPQKPQGQPGQGQQGGQRQQGGQGQGGQGQGGQGQGGQGQQGGQRPQGGQGSSSQGQQGQQNQGGQPPNATGGAAGQPARAGGGQ